MEAFYEQLENLPLNLSNHLLITVLPLAIGFSVSLPLAFVAVRSRRLRYPLLTVVSVVQTFPSLALLALIVAILMALGEVTQRRFGFDLPALGFYPTVIALTLYSMLPMLRNMVTGILEVDPAMTEAARGVGMTPMQSLWKVEVPLALPVIIAGVRTATVWTVGIATLATPVGQRCLGNYIFAGLQTRNWVAVIFGCLAAAALAILLDLLIGGLQKAAAERRRGLALVSGAALVLVFLGGLVAPWLVGEADAVIGSKTFTEQYILAELIDDTLEESGLSTRKMESLGSAVVFSGLVDGEIDVYVDYTGTVWANYMKQEGSAPPQKVLQAVSRWVEQQHGAKVVGALGFENAYALAMRREQATRLGVTTIGDLARHAPQMTVGGDYEFFDRPEWKAVRTAYKLNFAERRSFDSTFMYQAVANGTVDVISAFTSDGRIEQYDLVLLEDPEHAIPPYDAIILLSPKAARRGDIVAALQSLVGSISLEAMRHANYLVDRREDKRTVNEAADWLARRIGREE